MNLAGRVLLGVAVCYCGWADRQMAGWKMLVGTAALHHYSSAVLQHYSTVALQLHSQYSDVSKQLSVEK